METWILVTVVVFVTGAAVIATLFGEDSPLRHPGLRGGPDQPIRPVDLRSISFPTRFRGYDPVLVDQWLAAAADALEIVSDTAGADLVALADEQFVDDGRSLGEIRPNEGVEDDPPPRPIDLLSQLPQRDAPPDPGPARPPRFDPSDLL